MVNIRLQNISKLIIEYVHVLINHIHTHRLAGINIRDIKKRKR
jgi:hypothetical protein